MILPILIKRFVVIFCLLFFFCQPAVGFGANKIPTGPVPGWVTLLPVKGTTTVKAKDVSGGYHVLLRDTQADLESQTYYYHNGFMVFSDEGLPAVSEIQVNYDPNYEQVTFHAIRVWRNGQLIDKLATVKFKQSQVEKEVDKHIYNEQLAAIAILSDVRINDVVEYAYSVKGWNPIFQNKFFSNFYLSNYDPIDELYLRVNTTPSRKINYKLFNYQEQPTVTMVGNRQTYTWHRKNVPASPVDSDIPAWYEPHAWVSLSEFKNWPEFGQWAAPLYEVKGLSKELQQEIDSIKNTSGDAGERITATVRFVQDKIRYLGLENGINGYKPHAPAQVYQQRFGDCKDKSLLLTQMLRAMNINAYPALVHTNHQDQVQKWLPSAYAFNHCIVLIELLGRKIWIDPTINLQRGTYDSIATPNYKAALVLKNNGGEFVRMQTPQVAKIKVLENFIFNDIGGPVTLEVKTYYYGSEADMMRSRLATSNLKEEEKSYLNFYANSYPNISLSRDLDLLDDPQKNIITTLEEYTINDLWTPAQKNKDSVLTASFYPQVLRTRLGTPGTVIRKMPISLYYPFEFEEKITLLLPETWPIEAETQVIQDKSFWFQSDISYQTTSNSIVLRYRYQNRRDHVPVTEATAYLKKQKEVITNLGYELTKSRNAKPAGGSVSGLMVGLALLFLLGWAFGGYQLYHFDPLLQEPSEYEQHIGGWLMLVLIGLYSSTLVLVGNLLTNNFFEVAIWPMLTDTESIFYRPGHAWLILFELAYNTGMLVYTVLLIVLFHQRRTSVPRLMVLFYGMNLLFICLDNAVAVMLQITEADFKQIIRAVVAGAIWVPYFIKSDRVKRTFTKTLRQPATEQLYEPLPQEEEPLVRA